MAISSKTKFAYHKTNHGPNRRCGRYVFPEGEVHHAALLVVQAGSLSFEAGSISRLSRKFCTP